MPDLVDEMSDPLWRQGLFSFPRRRSRGWSNRQGTCTGAATILDDAASYIFYRAAVLDPSPRMHLREDDPRRNRLRAHTASSSASCALSLRSRRHRALLATHHRPECRPRATHLRRQPRWQRPADGEQQGQNGRARIVKQAQIPRKSSRPGKSGSARSL
jgi:hypothetical protein